MSMKPENRTDYPKGDLTDNPLSYPSEPPSNPPGYPSNAPPCYPSGIATGYPSGIATGYPSGIPTGYLINNPTQIAQTPPAFPHVSYTAVPQMLTVETPKILQRRSCPLIGFGILQIIISTTGIICAAAFKDSNGAVHSFSEHVLLTHVCFLLEAMLTIYGGCHYKKRTEVLYISFIVGILGMFLAIVAFATSYVFLLRDYSSYRNYGSSENYRRYDNDSSVTVAYMSLAMTPLNMTCAIILSALECCKVCRCCVCYRCCTE